MSRLPGLDTLDRATWAGVFQVFYSLGFAAPVQQNWSFLRTGLQITIFPTSQVLAESTSTNFSTAAGALPQEVRPAVQSVFVVSALNNSAGVLGIIRFNSDNGAIGLGASTTSTVLTNWTAANNKGFPLASTSFPQFTYMGLPLAN